MFKKEIYSINLYFLTLSLITGASKDTHLHTCCTFTMFVHLVFAVTLFVFLLEIDERKTSTVPTTGSLLALCFQCVMASTVCLSFLLFLIFSCAFCCFYSHLMCLMSVIPHICALCSLSGEICCVCSHVFAQKRTDRGRACWLQLYSFCLFSVVCVQYALHVCTFTCSQILIGQQGFVKGTLKGTGRGMKSFYQAGVTVLNKFGLLGESKPEAL